jgi:aspartate racemase
VEERFGLDVLVPEEDQRQIVHDVIFGELARGEIRPASRDAYKQITERLVARGASGIILGCTEFTLLISQADVSVPVFDTTAIHAQAAVAFALGPDGRSTPESKLV